MDKILVIKKSGIGSDKLTVKVKPKARNSYVPDDYVKVVNPQDSNDLALLLSDLDLVVGAPMDKAIAKYKQNKGKSFPF